MRNFTRKSVLLAVAALALGGIIEFFAAAWEPAQNLIEQRLYYAALDRFGSEVKVDPRIKILSFDDSSAALLQSPSMKLVEFARIARKLQDRGVTALLYAGMMSFVRDSPAELEEAASSFAEIDRMKIGFGVFTGPNIQYRDAISKDFFQAAAVPSAPPAGDFVYGPHRDVLRKGMRLGHVVSPRLGTITSPYVRLDADHSIPSLALAALDDQVAEQGKLRLGGREVPLTDAGEVMFPLLINERVKKITHSLRRPLGAIDHSSRAPTDFYDNFQHGDWVLLDPAGYTGGAAWQETPRGNVPARTVIASLVNAVLSGKWIEFGPWRRPMSAFAFVVALLLGWFSPRTRTYLTASMIALTVLTSCAIFGFLYGDVCLPLLSPAVQLVFVGNFVHAVRQAERDRLKRLVQLSLEKDFDLANRIQDSLSPPERETVLERFEVTCMQAKHDALGGDWMAWRTGRPGEVYFAVGDATGKGVQAALICHAVQSLWADALGKAEFDPEDFLRRANSTLVTLGRSQPHTLTLGILRMTETRLTYWSAGHIPVVVVGKGKTRRICSSGDILGFGENLNLFVKTCDIDPADENLRIVLASDGVLSGSSAMTERKVKDLVEGVGTRGESHLAEIDEKDDKTLILIRNTQRAANSQAA